MKRTMLFAALMLATQAQAAPRGLSPHDLVTLDRVSAPALSPDAKQLAYVLRQVDYEANKGVTGIWLTDLEGNSPKRLTPADSTANTPQWSPDGKHLYYLSTRSGSIQVWRQPVAGGDAQQVTDYPLDVGSYLVSPRGDAVAFSLEVFADCDTVACTKQRLDAKPKGSGKLYDKLFVRHWDTWVDGRRNQLFVSSLAANGGAAAEPVKLSRGIDGDVPSKPFGDQSEYAWSPDGEEIVFGARIAGRTEPWSTNFDLYRVGVDGKVAPANLTAANPAWDTGPVFSADGNTLYYRAMKRPGFEADRFAVMAMDLDSKQVREIAASWDASADNLVLSGDRLSHAPAVRRSGGGLASRRPGRAAVGERHGRDPGPHVRAATSGGLARDDRVGVEPPQAPPGLTQAIRSSRATTACFGITTRAASPCTSTGRS